MVELCRGDCRIQFGGLSRFEVELHFPSGVKVLSLDVKAATGVCRNLMNDHTGRTSVRQA